MATAVRKPFRLTAAQGHKEDRVFTLKIGVNQQNPQTKINLNFQRDVAVRLKQVGIPTYWGVACQMAEFPVEGKMAPGFVLSKVRTVLSITELEDESLYRLEMWAPGLLAAVRDGMPRGSCSFKGQCSFNIQTLNPTSDRPVTGFYVVTNDFPYGFENTIDAFEISARHFMSIMRVIKRKEDAERHLAEGHNYTAVAAKLAGIPNHMDSLTVMLRDYWSLLMERPLEVVEAPVES